MKRTLGVILLVIAVILVGVVGVVEVFGGSRRGVSGKCGTGGYKFSCA